jgi:hypothetical protein
MEEEKVCDKIVTSTVSDFDAISASIDQSNDEITNYELIRLENMKKNEVIQ